MIYFDTDVIVNYLINQDGEKQDLAVKAFETASTKEECFISLLTLQELTFVLAKLEIAAAEIRTIIGLLLQQASPSQIDSQVFQRALEFAGHVGHKNFNDCLHVALAEQHCQSLITFNKKDFKKLQQYAAIKIEIL